MVAEGNLVGNTAKDNSLEINKLYSHGPCVVKFMSLAD